MWIATPRTSLARPEPICRPVKGAPAAVLPTPGPQKDCGPQVVRLTPAQSDLAPWSAQYFEATGAPLTTQAYVSVGQMSSRGVRRHAREPRERRVILADIAAAEE